MLETRGLSFSDSERWESHDQKVGYAYVEYRKREKSSPVCPEKLVEADSRECRSKQHYQHDDYQSFQQHPEERGKKTGSKKPSQIHYAEKGRERVEFDKTGALGCEEEHPRIFGLPTHHDFGFCLGKVEWESLHFCDAGDQEDERSESLREDVPSAGLGFNNLGKVHCSRHHYDAKSGKPQWNFVCCLLKECS